MPANSEEVLDVLDAPEVPGIPLSMVGYKHSSQCSICSAVDQDTGISIRFELEREYTKLNSYVALAKLYEKRTGQSLHQTNAMRHIKEHAPYIRTMTGRQSADEFFEGLVNKRVDGITMLENVMQRGYERIRKGEIIVDAALWLKAQDLYYKIKGQKENEDILSHIRNNWIKKLSQQRAVEGEVIEGSESHSTNESIAVSNEISSDISEASSKIKELRDIDILGIADAIED